MEACWARAAPPGPTPDLAAMGLGQEPWTEETDLGRRRDSESIAPSRPCHFRVDFFYFQVSVAGSDSAITISPGRALVANHGRVKSTPAGEGWGGWDDLRI
jgi:hypothetical protein